MHKRKQSVVRTVRFYGGRRAVVAQIYSFDKIRATTARRPPGLKAVASIFFLIATFAHAEPQPEKITYTEHILPIFRESCLNCHNPEKRKAGLDLSTYQAAMAGDEGGPVVTSGDPQSSLLFTLITHADEPEMPPKSDKLPDAQIELIKKWIEQNAPENSNSKTVAAKPNELPALISAAANAAEKNPDEKPSGPPPMPRDPLLEPVVRTSRAGAVASIAASPRAPLLAVAGQKQVLLYQTDTFDLAGVLPFSEGFPQVVKFSRDGRLVLAGGGLAAKWGHVVLWNVETGARVAEIGNEFDSVLAADISPDQTQVALGGPSKLVKIFSTRDGSLLHSIKKHTDWVTAISFTPDGKSLVTGDRAGNLSVWDADAHELFSLTGHKAAITAIACLNNVIASASEDGTIKLWDVREGRQIKSWNAHNGGALAVAFAPDGRIVSCGRDKLAKLWDANGKQLRASEPFSDVALQVAFSASNGGRFIAGDWTGTIRAWDAGNGKRIAEFSPNPPTIAERVAAVEKRLAEVQALNEKLARAQIDAEKTAASMDVEARLAANVLTVSETRVKETEALFATAKNETAQADENASENAPGAAAAGDGNEKPSDAISKAENDFTKAQKQLEAAKHALEQKTNAAKNAAEKVGKNKALISQAAQQLAAAKRDAAKWQAAQINAALHAARQQMSERQSVLDKALAAAKAGQIDPKTRLEKTKLDQAALAAGVAFANAKAAAEKLQLQLENLQHAAQTEQGMQTVAAQKP